MHRTALLTAALAASTALADVTLTFEGTTYGAARTTTLQMKGKRLLLSSKGKDDGHDIAVLHDGDHKRTLSIDHSKKAYVEFSDEAVAAMKAQDAQMQAAMAAQMARLPSEKRAQLEAMMAKMPGHAAPAGSSAAPPKKAYTFEKKGTSRKVNGKTCEDYVVKADGVVDGEGCFIAWKDVGVSRDELRKQFLTALEGFPGFDEWQAAGDAAIIAGAPLGLLAWRKHVDAMGNVQTDYTLKSLSTAPIPDATFEVPGGYTAHRPGPHGRP
jgi:hypothetical protein